MINNPELTTAKKEILNILEERDPALAYWIKVYFDCIEDEINKVSDYCSAGRGV